MTESANVMFQEDNRQLDMSDISQPVEDYEELLLFVNEPEEDSMNLVSVDSDESSLSDGGSGDPDEEWLARNEQVLHGESTKRLAQPRDTKVRKLPKSAQTIVNRHTSQTNHQALSKGQPRNQGA